MNKTYSTLATGNAPTQGAAQVLDAGWRAAAYCLHPRVIGWSLLPLVLGIGISFGAYYFLWDVGVTAIRAQMESWLVVDALLKWLDGLGASGFRSVLAPMVFVAISLPLIMALSLMLVALLMTPALTKLVAERRFAQLELRRGGTFFGGVVWSLSSTALALAALLVSMPFWLIPPVVLVLPPLIWGWLSYRVFAYDVLADYASAEERRQILREHRWPLLAIGVVSGYLGAAPSLLFAFGAMSLALAPLLMPIAIWLYMLVFAFAALWFAHFALSTLQGMRHVVAPAPVALADVVAEAVTPSPPVLPPH